MQIIIEIIQITAKLVVLGFGRPYLTQANRTQCLIILSCLWDDQKNIGH